MKERDFEYAIRQDVKNNPIVREVDRGRVAEMWRWAAVLAGLGAVLVFSGWQQFQVLRFGYLIEETREQIQAEDAHRRRLELERTVLISPRRLEKLAITQLGLKVPSPTDTYVVERVEPATPPTQAVVASR